MSFHLYCIYTSIVLKNIC